MIEKIGRNDKCPCMSGKKYKNCCEKTGIWDNFKKQNLLYKNEEYILSDLIDNDDIFKNLYLRERIKVNKPVLFFESQSNLMAEMSYGSIEDLAYTIMTPYNKIPLEKSIHAAHELIHVVICSEGYETIKNIDSNSRLHKMINDMVYDPLVNKRLISYGYNLEAYFKLSDEVQIGMPRIGENVQLVKTLFVKRILDYRNLNSEITEDDIEFIKWAKSFYPDVIEDSRKILEIIDTTGISTPSEVKEVFKQVISYLGLENKLFI